jgi:hypothetical protein
MLTGYLQVQPPSGHIVIKGTVAARTFLQRLIREQWAVRHAVAVEYDPTNASVMRLIETSQSRGYELTLYGSELIATGCDRVARWIRSDGSQAAHYHAYPPAVAAAAQLFGLEEVTAVAVMQQYRRLALAAHPDKGCADPEAFQRVNAAKEVLLAHLSTQAGTGRR